jgi:triosephosphate isomerase (TIM)
MSASVTRGRHSMARPLLAANWKMNFGPDEARSFVTTYIERAASRADRTVVLFPPALALAAARDAAGRRPDLQFGVQNVFWEPRGAYTGELSAPMAHAAGAAFVLVGHSERRHIFHESDVDTGRKCAAVTAAGLTPVLCVGELLAERESGTTADVVVRQLHAGLARLSAEQISGAVVAYEPVWAIGTGRTATPADASETHAILARALRRLLPPDAPMIPILYGGSANADNASALLSAPGVDGLLVGGASLDPISWAAIVEAPIAGASRSRE